MTEELPRGARVALEVMSKDEEVSLLDEIDHWAGVWERPICGTLARRNLAR